MTLAVDAGGLPAIAMSVTPRVAHVPGRVRIRAIVEPDAKNRGLQIVADSDDYYRSSTVQSDGAAGARITVVQFAGLPLGNYRISANLLGSGDTIRATIHRDVIVASPESTSTPKKLSCAGTGHHAIPASPARLSIFWSCTRSSVFRELIPI